MLPLLPIAMTALNAASTVTSFIGAGAQAKAQNQNARAVQAAQDAYRDEVMRYQNNVWQQDIEYAREVLSYSKTEFEKQGEWARKAMDAVEQNRNADAFTLMVRGIEETIASTFATTSAQRQGRAATAAFQARERGVEGNSVEAVVGDVMRQEGEARTMVDINRSATMRQLGREAMALDANADAQMSQIAGSIRTFAPQAPIRTPSPLNPMAPQAPVAAPSTAGLVTGLANNFMGGVRLYGDMTGQNTQQTLDGLTSWASRRFSLGGNASPNTYSSPVGGTP